MSKTLCQYPKLRGSSDKFRFWFSDYSKAAILINGYVSKPLVEV